MGKRQCCSKEKKRERTSDRPRKMKEPFEEQLSCFIYMYIHMYKYPN